MSERKSSIAPAVPRHPERICWGCDLRCPAEDLKCGEDTPRSKHPSEVFGADWVEWARNRDQPAIRGIMTRSGRRG